MTARLLDGATVTSGGRDFTAHDDPPDEDGHGARWFTCDHCYTPIAPSDDALADHDCQQCPGCDDWFTVLPIVDTENGQRYCTDDCHETASERYWTAVWSA